jgi:hypothetical protein
LLLANGVAGVLTARVVVAVLLHRVVLVLLRVLRVVLGHDADAAASSVLRHRRLNGCGGVEGAGAPRVVVWTDRVGRARGDGADGRFRPDSDAARDVGHDARVTAAASDDATTATAHHASVVDVVVSVTDGTHSDTPVVDSTLLGRSGRIGSRGRRRSRRRRLVVGIDLLAGHAARGRPVRIDSETQRESVRLLGPRLSMSTVEAGLFKVRVHHFRSTFSLQIFSFRLILSTTEKFVHFNSPHQIQFHNLRNDKKKKIV